MLPELTLIAQLLQATAAARLAEIDTKINLARQQIEILTVQRNALRSLMETEQMAVLARQTMDAVVRPVPAALETALLEVFRANRNSMRWTDAVRDLIARGILANPPDVLAALKASTQFRDAGQGWYRLAEHANAASAERHTLTPAPKPPNADARPRGAR